MVGTPLETIQGGNIEVAVFKGGDEASKCLGAVLTEPILEIRKGDGEHKVGVVVGACTPGTKIWNGPPTGSLWYGSYRLHWFGFRKNHSNAIEVFAVLARWIVNKDGVAEFGKAISKNAEISATSEAGCYGFGFGILIDENTPRSPGPQKVQEYVLIECFREALDFAEHLKTEHFQSFRQAVAPFFLGDREGTAKGWGVLRLDQLRKIGQDRVD